jgi:plasmid segregation protein ParM
VEISLPIFLLFMLPDCFNGRSREQPSRPRIFYSRSLMMAARVVNELGLDVGHGYVKVCHRGGSGELVMRAFRSVALPRNETGIASAMRGACMSSSLVTVEVDGVNFEIDVSEEAVVTRRRAEWNEDNGFPLRPEYRALARAALASTGFGHVGVLVVGLPVHTFQRYRAELASQLGGLIKWDGGQMTVGEVLAIPQPVGCALTLHGEEEGRLGKALVALIDVGQFTTDFLVARGLTIDFDRSGGRPGGASHIYRAVADGISAELGVRFDHLDQIELALRTGEPLLAFGKELDIKPHLERANQAALETVRAIQAKLGSTEDLTFVLSGGGGPLYLDALKQVFPRNRIVELGDARFRNVAGFLLYGERLRGARG